MGFIVYRYISPNGKSYIGQTKNSLDVRANDLKGSGYKGSIKFWAAINKYGWEWFRNSREILIENLSQEEANFWERYYINYYDSINNGYNIQDGGQDSENLVKINQIKVVRIDYITKEEKVYNSLREASLDSNIKECNISLNIYKKIKQVKHFFFVPFNIWQKLTDLEKSKYLYEVRTTGNQRPVYCVETKKKFASLTEAAKYYNLQNAKICQCCKKERKTTGKKHWYYLDEWESFSYKEQQKIEKEANFIKKILCIETQKIYDSPTLAMQATGVDRSSIARCCTGKQKTAGKMHWQYI